MAIPVILDSGRTVGSRIVTAKGFRAFAIDGRDLGDFSTRELAVDALAEVTRTENGRRGS